MKQKFEDFKAWMDWRGITGKDLVMMGSSMGFLLFIMIVLICGLVESLV